MSRSHTHALAPVHVQVCRQLHQQSIGEHAQEREKLLQKLADLQAVLQQRQFASESQLRELSTEIERLTNVHEQQNTALAQSSVAQAKKISDLQQQLLSAQQQLLEIEGEKQEDVSAVVQQLAQVRLVVFASTCRQADSRHTGHIRHSVTFLTLVVLSHLSHLSHSSHLS